MPLVNCSKAVVEQQAHIEEGTCEGEQGHEKAAPEHTHVVCAHGEQRVDLGERELEGLGWDLNNKPHAHLATRKLQQDPASIQRTVPSSKRVN